MALHLFGTKPLSEPMMEYCWLNPWDKLQWSFDQNLYILIQENAFQNVVCKMMPYGVLNLVITAVSNGFAPVGHQAIIWTNAGLLVNCAFRNKLV